MVLAEQIHAKHIRCILENWSAISAAVIPPPDDIAFYQQALLAANLPSGATVLLLDSTSELRDMVLRQGLRLIRCNMDAVFWEAMPGLIVPEGDETFLNPDWLEVAEGQRYDLLLGGSSLDMLTWEDVQTLISKTHRLLKSGGRVVLRAKTANKQLTLNSLRQAIENYPTVRCDHSFLTYLHDLIESLRNTYFPVVTRREFYESVVSEHLTIEEMTEVRSLLRDRKHCYPTRTVFIDLLQQHFEILLCQPSAASCWGTAHLYMLKKKSLEESQLKVAY